MARDRLKKANRIRSVQTLLLRRAEWQAGSILRERERLEVARQELLKSMGSELFGAVLMEQAARRLSHVALQSADVAAAKATQDEKVRAEGLSLKRAERAVAVAAQASRMADDRARTTEIAEESAVRRADASLA
jgi:hypothetical protein